MVDGMAKKSAELQEMAGALASIAQAVDPCKTVAQAFIDAARSTWAVAGLEPPAKEPAPAAPDGDGIASEDGSVHTHPRATRTHHAPQAIPPPPVELPPHDAELVDLALASCKGLVEKRKLQKKESS